MIVTPTFCSLPAPILAHAKNQGHGNTSTDERITDVACCDHGCLIQVNTLSVELANEAHWVAWPDGGGWRGGGEFGLFRFYEKRRQFTFLMALMREEVLG